MTQPSSSHHSFVCQALIGNHESLEIMDDLITKFYQQFDLLTVVRLLNSVHSLDHTRIAQHVVACMNYHIYLLLTASKSTTGMAIYFKTTSLVWDLN